MAQIDKETAKSTIKKLVEKYESEKSAGKISQYTEADTKTGFIEPLFQALGWDTQNRNEVSLETNISGGRVDYSFKIADVVKFFVEAKPLKADLDKPEYIEQTINYAWHKNVVWTILTDFESIKVFNAERKAKTTADSKFFEIPYNEYITKFDQLWLLSKELIINGNLDKEAEKWGKKLKKQPVSKQILDDLLIAREKLTENINSHSKLNKITEQELDESVQRILDRLIFIRTCEDRNIEQNHLITAVRNQRGKGIREELKNIFTKFDEAYNSKLFEKHLCEQLTIDDEVIAEVIELLYHTKDETIHYDFSMINADVLGNIYEQYLGHILKKTPHSAKLKETHQHRKEQGIYYTPSYIVDYIVRNTVGEVLKKTKLKKVAKLKILDPACGSGSFLIRAFDEFVDYYQKKSPGEFGYFRKVEILKNNIYGVDLDKQAVEITQMNLLLKTLYHRQRLPMLKNIRCGNSLIDDPAVAGDKAFKWDEEFPDVIARRSRGNLGVPCHSEAKPKNLVFEKMQSEESRSKESPGGFDVIIGNPPFLLLQPSNTDMKLIDFIKNNYKSAQYKIDIYHLFIEKAISLLNKDGLLGFITPNTFLTNLFTVNLRKYIVDNCKVINIVVIPESVFPEASVDTSIIVVKKCSSEKKRKENIIRVNFMNEDLKSEVLKNEIPQSDVLRDKNYVFNVNITKEVKVFFNKFNSTGFEILGDIAHPYFGIQTYDRNKYVSDTKRDRNFRPVIDGKNITRYHLKDCKEYVSFVKHAIKSGGDETVYEGEKLFIRQIGKYPIATFGPKGIYSLNTVYNIYLKNNYYDLKYLLSIINSKFAQYFWKLKFSDSKELFPKIKRSYLEAIPIRKANRKEQSQVVNLVDKMLDLNKQLQKFGDKLTDERKKIESEIQKTDKQIDELVYKLYGLTAAEIKIIDGKTNKL